VCRPVSLKRQVVELALILTAVEQPHLLEDRALAALAGAEQQQAHRVALARRLLALAMVH